MKEILHDWDGIHLFLNYIKFAIHTLKQLEVCVGYTYVYLFHTV